MNENEAIKHILDGEAVLFVGAGFSLGAKNLRSKGLMSGTAIAKHFSELANLPPETGLEDAAEVFSTQKGIDALIKEVQEEFTVQEVCDYHRKVAALPWKRIYTTNYDNVFERASSLEKKRVSSVTTSTDIYQIAKDHAICVHLNGSVQNLDREKMGSELKLTEVSYVTSSLADTQWAMMLRQDFRLASAVFFIGYSLYDLDIKKILLETEDSKNKIFFYLGPNPDKVTTLKASRYGSVLHASTEDFVELAKEVAKSHTPRDSSLLRTVSIKKHDNTVTPVKISDIDFINLLLWGVRSDKLVSESFRTNVPYCLKRAQIDKAFELISQGVRVIIVVSDLGNGKSLFLEGLRTKACEKGYEVYNVNEKNDGVERELESVAKLKEKTIVTIEEYQNWLKEIRTFRTNAGPDSVLILTARNVVHDVVFDDLALILKKVRVHELNIDTLDDKEVEWVVSALDTYGLWGEYAGNSRDWKFKYISEGCGRQFHAFLLKLLTSPDIAKRLSSVVGRIRAKGENYEPLLSIFILTILNFPASLEVLTDVWGVDRISSTNFRTDPVIKEFINWDYHEVHVRSPIVSEYVLKSISNAGTLIPILNTMANQIAKGSRTNERYNDLFKNLMRFSSLQLILPEEGKKNAVIKYYEALKNLERCKRNPLFWLQYAIASLVIEDLVRAKRYFDTAYSFAVKKGYDAFQIDNHYARFLMVQAIKEEMSIEAAMANYREARGIIEREMRDERLHYPYRVGIHFQDFLNSYGAKMGLPEIEEFASSAERIAGRIDDLPDYQRNNKYILECRKVMRYVTDNCATMVAKLKK